MRYAMLIYTDESSSPAPDSREAKELFDAYYAFDGDVRARGVHKGGEALQGIATATTVRVRDGETLVTDGPFAETKEQLGGFYLLDCKDLDEAIELAARIPNAKDGSIEIRPIQELAMG